MDSVLELMHYGTILIFGVYLSAAFLGVWLNRRNILILLVFCVVSGAIDAVSKVLFGAQIAAKLYPLFTHVPLILFLMFFYKYKLIPTMTSVFTAYLSCQLSKWMGILFLAFTGLDGIYYLVRVITTIVVFIWLIHYVAPAIAQLLQKPTKDVMIFGLLPFAYYFYDYTVTVYTELFYSGDKVITELLGCMLYIFYVIFVLVYFKQYEEKREAQQRNQFLEMQRIQSEKDVEMMKRSEYLVAILRHDMRHFLNDINNFIKNEEYDRAQSYINEVITNVDETVTQKYCSNKIVNLILSSYENTIRQKKIDFQYSIKIPDELSFSDSDISSVLSNGFENAINAVSSLDTGKRKIELDMHMNNDKLLISIKNTYDKKPNLVDGVPKTDEEGHGFGTRSICYITDKLKGKCQFLIDDEYFVLKIIL